MLCVCGRVGVGISPVHTRVCAGIPNRAAGVAAVGVRDGLQAELS